MNRVCVLSLLVLLGAAVPLEGQQRTARTARASIDTAVGTPNYDVVLEVPRLSVDSLILSVDDLDARLNARARVANLVALDAGVAVRIDSVGLRLEGVGAQAFLYVDLDNVSRIVVRVVQTLDRNPELLTRVLSVVDTTVGAVGGIANTALQPGGVGSQAVGIVGNTLSNLTRPGGVLTQTVNTTGQTVQLTLGTAGQLLNRTLDASGRVVNEQNLGALSRLPLVRETAGQAGQTLRQVRLPSGQLVEYVTDQAGRVLGARAVSR